MMRVDVAVFDGVDELDVVGPLEVLRSVGNAGRDLESSLVARDARDVITGKNGMRFIPDSAYRPGADVLVIPGGGWGDGSDSGVRREIRDEQWPGLIETAHRAGTVIVGVCSGVLLLGHAGLLTGRRANTHPASRAEVERLGAVLDDSRVVFAEDIVTCGGVTSGIDAALALVRHCFGDGTAHNESYRLQYPPESWSA